MFIARSFDINKPGAEIKNLVGGILGGALKQGKLKVNDEIEIKPGIRIEKEGKEHWIQIKTKITGIKAGGKSLKEVTPGGSMGILTNLDPSMVKSDNLSGNLAGHPRQIL